MERVFEPDAIIFDMDGVLVNSEVHWKAVESEFLSGLVPGWSDADQSAILGMSAYDVHARLVEKYGLTLSREAYIEYYRGLSQTIYGERSALLPGVSQLVRSLHERGTLLALASSSPHSWIDIVLERFDLRRCFRAIVSSDDLGGKGKPAPDIYLKAAERLGVNPIRCVAIEDTRKGLQSAQAAGMRTIGVLNGFNHPADVAAAGIVLQGFEEMTVDRLLELARSLPLEQV
ncbi:MAG: HAD family phosphatase [Bdellovibrionota bacterium]